MKIKPEHYEVIRTAIDALPKDKLSKHKEALKGDARVKDIDKRFRWDCLDVAVKAVWICDNLYSYMDDTHIDTALRAVVKDLGI